VHDDSLQQIAFGGQYSDHEKTKPTVGLQVAEPDSDTCVGFDEIPSKVVWDEMPTNQNIHDGLLQQLAWDEELL
jgi:hypothetical protein